MMHGMARHAAALRPGRVAHRRRQLDRQVGEAADRPSARARAASPERARPAAAGPRLPPNQAVAEQAASRSRAKPRSSRRAASLGCRLRFRCRSGAPAPPRRRHRVAGPPSAPAAPRRAGRDWPASADRRQEVISVAPRGLGVARAQLRQRAELERAVAPGIVCARSAAPAGPPGRPGRPWRTSRCAASSSPSVAIERAASVVSGELARGCRAACAVAGLARACAARRRASTA